LPGKDPVGSELPDRVVFLTTRWSAVLAAGSNDTTQAQAALEQLCRHYWPPLYAYVRRAGHSSEDAQDLTQEFFARLLARHSLAQADRERGRFRSFLLGSLKHFLAHEWERARAQKRGGRVQFIPLPNDTDGAMGALPAAANETPDRAFDRQWALTLLDLVLDRLRREYANAGRDDLFLGLKETLGGGRAEIPYRDLARRLGMSEGAVKVAAHRLRRRYRELLREEIARTVATASDTEDELGHLFAALGG
jgi:RNA polymerase sigma-70 factor (ECF subfamily)